MTKETILFPGLFYNSCPKPGQLSIEQIVDKQLVANGYPVLRPSNCPAPNICDIIGDCTLQSVVCALNGLSGTGAEGDCVVLGGTLFQNTDVDTDAFSMSFSKLNVKMELANSGGAFGPGEVARFYGTDGTTTAQMGVYTSSGGVPSTTIQTYNDTTTFYSRIQHRTALDTFVIDAGQESKAYNPAIYFDVDTVSIGLTGSSDTNLTVKKFAFTGGTDVIQLINLPTFADNSAAAAASLPVDALYKTAAGDLRIRV